MAKLLDEHGMLIILFLVASALCLATLRPHETSGRAAGLRMGEWLAARQATGNIVVIATDTADDQMFLEALKEAVSKAGVDVLGSMGGPIDARKALEKAAGLTEVPTAIVCSRSASDWILLKEKGSIFPGLAKVPLITPEEGVWPAFLTRANLLNIANQIAVISIISIGMTVVVAIGGIDLSVGSLVALSGVLAADFIRHNGGTGAAFAVVTTGCLLGILAATAAGVFSGAVISGLGVPPFLATLATMLVVRGTTLEWTGGESIAALPDGFVWLGRGNIGPIPVAMALMVILYGVFHIMMTRSVVGRYWLAIGGNPVVARLAGIPVNATVIAAYAVSGALAGLGGILLTSQLRNASPTYGDGYELTVIAAVVVGGASLSGGKARMTGTLTGAFLIATIQNGMNLMGVSPFVQRIVLGTVILAAVVFDRWRQIILDRFVH